MKKRKVCAIMLAATMTVTMMPGLAFADGSAAGKTFMDMPDDWSTSALQNAVSNGLITGYATENGKVIKPQGSLTRAELATIVNKAFGASEKASLSGVSDVVAGAWYETQIAAAVQMGTFAKDSQMRPEANITRQEAMTVLARAFKLDDNAAAAEQFADSSSIASWAKGSTGAMAAAGYVTGSNGSLSPAANISRAEFAKIMDGMVAKYFTAAGTYSEAPAEGNVMVNAPGVTLKDIAVAGDLILGDGIGSGDVTLDGVKVSGKIIVRGGGENSVIILGQSQIGTVVVSKTFGTVRIKVEGAAKVGEVRVVPGSNDVIVAGPVSKLNIQASSVVVNAQSAAIAEVTMSGENAAFTVDKDSKVDAVAVEKAAEGALVQVSGVVTAIKTDAPATAVSAASGAKIASVETTSNAKQTIVTADKGSSIADVKSGADKTVVQGQGTVSKVTVTGDNCQVNTNNTKTEVAKDAAGATAGKNNLTSGSTTTTGSNTSSEVPQVKPGGSVTPPGNTTNKPSTGGGSGSGGSGGGSGGGDHNTATDTVVVRPAGPATSDGAIIASYDYAAGYQKAGAAVTSGTDKNSNEVKINVTVSKLTDSNIAPAITKKLPGGKTYAFVGLKFIKPSGATSAIVKIGNGSGTTVDLTTESDDVFGGEYITYFGIAENTTSNQWKALPDQEWAVKIEWKKDTQTLKTVDYSVKRVTNAVAESVGASSAYAYASMAEAIKGASSGDTVKLIKNDTKSEPVIIDKVLTLDGNNKTVSGGLHLKEAVTVKNLNINPDGSSPSSMVSTVVGDKTAVYIEHGDVLITNCAITAKATAVGKSVNGITVEPVAGGKTSLERVGINNCSIAASNGQDQKSYGIYSASSKIVVKNNTVNARIGIGVENIIDTAVPVLADNHITKTGSAHVYLMGLSTYFAGTNFGQAGSQGITSGAVSFVQSLVEENKQTGNTVIVVDTYSNLSTPAGNLTERYTYSTAGVMIKQEYYEGSSSDWKVIDQTAAQTVKAPLADQSGSLAASKLVEADYSASASRRDDGVIVVTITGSAVQLHQDAAGRWGNWVGFGAEIPSDAVGQKLVIKKAGTLEGLKAANVDTRTVLSVSADLTESGVNYWTNYVNAGADEPMVYWSLQFGDRAPVIYCVDLTGVTSAGVKKTLITPDKEAVKTIAANTAFKGIEECIASGVQLVDQGLIDGIQTYTVEGEYVQFTKEQVVPGFAAENSDDKNFMVLPLRFTEPENKNVSLTRKKYTVTDGKVGQAHEVKTYTADDLGTPSVWDHLLRVNTPVTDTTTRFVLIWDNDVIQVFDLVFKSENITKKSDAKMQVEETSDEEQQRIVPQTEEQQNEDQGEEKTQFVESTDASQQETPLQDLEQAKKPLQDEEPLPAE